MKSQSSFVVDPPPVHLAAGGPYGEFQFRRLLEKLPAAAYTCDAEGLITYFNPQASALWGRAPRLNDPVDRFCGSFRLFSVDGAPIAHDQCWMAVALNTRREYNGQEIIIERPDGRRITALAHANPFIDESGALLGAVNVLVDISDRKRSEQVLREAHDVLAKRVMERTAELSELSHHLMQVAEDERTKLAAELHDEMGSLLTVLSMGIDRVRKRLETLAPELLDEQQQLIELMRTTIASQRRIVESLRPVLLDSFGLGIALRHHLEDWSRHTGISVHSDIATLPPLSADAGLALFRIAQESLTNVAKHTRAMQVRFSVSADSNQVTLIIEDNGAGMAATAGSIPSHGILGMRERLLVFGGRLAISPGQDGEGTRVQAVMPLAMALAPPRIAR